MVLGIGVSVYTRVITSPLHLRLNFAYGQPEVLFAVWRLDDHIRLYLASVIHSCVYILIVTSVCSTHDHASSFDALPSCI